MTTLLLKCLVGPKFVRKDRRYRLATTSCAPHFGSPTEIPTAIGDSSPDVRSGSVRGSVIPQDSMELEAVEDPCVTCHLPSKRRRPGSALAQLTEALYAAFLASCVPGVVSRAIIGCLGHFLPTFISNICKICHLQKHCVRNMFRQASKVAISCSYRIFNARSSELWDVPNLLVI